MIWKLDISVDYEHIISSGSDWAFPNEMDVFVAVLKKYGMSIIDGKRKKTKELKEILKD